MKLVNLIWIIIIMLSSCSKDSYEPIQLHYAIDNNKPNPIENNQVNLRFPTSDKTQLVIMGGDGNFTVTNTNEKTIAVSINNREVAIMPLTTGNSVVTIADKSNHSYMLNVKVDYRTIDMMIDKQDVIVVGDKLSEVQKAEIKQKATLTLPVKVNGGFKFVYTKGASTTQGQVFIYKDSFGVSGIESTFEEKRTELTDQRYPVFTINIDGKLRDFILAPYMEIKSKGDMIPTMALNEILIEQFKTEYPDVEKVYTQQRLINPK